MINSQLIQKIKLRIEQRGRLTLEELTQLCEIDSNIHTRLVAYSGMDVQTIKDRIRTGNFESNLILPILNQLN